MLRRVLAPALLVLGVTAIALAVASATVWRPADHLTASATGVAGTAALVTEPGVLHVADPEVALEAVSASGAELVLVYAPTADVEAWLGEDPVTRVTGLDRVEGVVVLTTTTTGTGTEPTPDPAGADLWWWELSGPRITTDLEREPGRLSVMVHSPAGAEDVTLTLSWPQEVVTPWVVPGVAVGSVLVLLALVLLVLRIRRDRADRAHEAAVEATAELAAVAGAPLTRRQLRELEASGVAVPGRSGRPDAAARAALRAGVDEARAGESPERERADAPAEATTDAPAEPTAVAVEAVAPIPAEPGTSAPTEPAAPAPADPGTTGPTEPAASPAAPRPMSRRELRLAAQRAARAAAPEDAATPGADPAGDVPPGTGDATNPGAGPASTTAAPTTTEPEADGPTTAEAPTGPASTDPAGPVAAGSAAAAGLGPAGAGPTDPAATTEPDPAPARPFPAAWATPAAHRAAAAPAVGPDGAASGDAGQDADPTPARGTDPADQDGAGQERRGWRRLFGRKGRPVTEPEPEAEPEPDVAWLPDPPAPPSVSADAWRRAWGFPDTPTDQPTGEEDR